MRVSWHRCVDPQDPSPPPLLPPLPTSAFPTMMMAANSSSRTATSSSSAGGGDTSQCGDVLPGNESNSGKWPAAAAAPGSHSSWQQSSTYIPNWSDIFPPPPEGPPPPESPSNTPRSSRRRQQASAQFTLILSQNWFRTKNVHGNCQCGILLSQSHTGLL